MAADEQPSAPVQPVPPVLRKRGIERVTDNIAPDQQLAVRGSMIWAFFGPELKARFLRKNDAATETRAPTPR